MTRQRKRRADYERRIEDLAMWVLPAVEERDAALAGTERPAGGSLRQMTHVKGLTLREAMDSCGEQIAVGEATRLRQLTVHNDEAVAATVKASVTTDPADAQAGE